MATACMVVSRGSGLLAERIPGFMSSINHHNYIQLDDVNLDNSELLSPSNMNERFKDFMNNVYPLGYDPQDIKRVPKTKFRPNANKRRRRKLAKASKVRNRRCIR